MTARLLIRSAGPGVTLQDGGRLGHLREGVTAAGPMDVLAYGLAIRAVGLAPGGPAIEVSLGGLEVEAEGAPLPVAVAGGEFRLSLDGAPLPPGVVLLLQPGQRLAVRPGRAGAWAYLAMAGELAVRPVLGSLATHTRSGIGGLAGRALAAGDVLPVRPPAAVPILAHQIHSGLLAPRESPIRVVLGPQDDFFAPDQIAAFLAGPWATSGRGDRMAYTLEGPALSHARGFNIVSDGIALGAIQVPGDGRPLVMLADRGSTGGYPKIATVIRADLGRLAQRRPGEAFRFAAVDVATAVAAWREAQAELAALELVPLLPDLTTERLLAHNLIDGVTAGE